MVLAGPQVDYQHEDDSDADLDHRTFLHATPRSPYCGLLCTTTTPNSKVSVYIDTSEPFTLVSVGKQGAGKSHTQNVILEEHLLPSHTGAKSHTAAVFHFSANGSPDSVSEAIGLCSDAALKSETFVLCSPNQPHRVRAYDEAGFRVRHLQFQWEKLTTSHRLALMQVDEAKQPLYSGMMTALLRKHQREEKSMSFKSFCAEVTAKCNVPGQEGPLLQRLALLDQFVGDQRESFESVDLSKILETSRLLIVDLTDPLFSPIEANIIFSIVLDMFNEAPLPSNRAGKIVALDEAHAFLDTNTPLSRKIINTVELMRHTGTRIIISTQCPEIVPTNLYELSSAILVHNLHRPSSLSFLRLQMPASTDMMNVVTTLRPGHCT